MKPICTTLALLLCALTTFGSEHFVSIEVRLRKPQRSCTSQEVANVIYVMVAVFEAFSFTGAIMSILYRLAAELACLVFFTSVRLQVVVEMVL